MNASTKNMSYWIRVAIWLGLSLMGWFLPAGEIITAYGVKVLGIFTGLMFGWICLDLMYPSFLAVLLMMFAGTGNANTLFYMGFSYDIVVIIFTLCTFCAFVSYVKLDSVIARWFLNLKFMEGKPWLFITMFMVLNFVMGYLIGIYATIFVVCQSLMPFVMK